MELMYPGKNAEIDPLASEQIAPPHGKGKSIKYNAELNTGNIGYFEL